MVVSDAIHNIMGGMESTAGVRLHNHRRKLKQRFDIIKKLGQGTYGKVQLGINKETGQEVAIKTIKKSKIETEADLIRIRREIQIMSSVQHPNIIHIYEVFENREKMVLVMEYAAGGELYDYLSERKVLIESEARRIFRQISTAVYYCHKHKICHRDLKLENILLDEHGSAKIADFGLSNVFDDQNLLGTFCGSPLYASPEIVKGTPYRGPEVDCWSLGVLLYTLVYGAMPFDGSNFKRLVKQISQGDYFEPKKPSPASALIRDMLHVDPVLRADIVRICSHWWMDEGQSHTCAEIAEELANQTPVRLDLLLSLAPQPTGQPGVVPAKDKTDGVQVAAPTRSQSVGSLAQLDHPTQFEPDFPTATDPAGKRRASVTGQEEGAKDAIKRKLEEGSSTEEANHTGAKRKERSRRRERSAERTSERKQHRSSSRTKHSKTSLSKPDMSETDSLQPKETKTKGEAKPVENVATSDVQELMEVDDELTAAKTIANETKSVSNDIVQEVEKKDKEVELEDGPPDLDKPVKADNEVKLDDVKKADMEDVKPSEDSKKVKVKRKKKAGSDLKLAETKDELVKTEMDVNKENLVKDSVEESSQLVLGVEKEKEVKEIKASEPAEVKVKVVKKTGAIKKKLDLSPTKAVEEAVAPTKPMVRRRSKLFDSEIQKFNNMSAAEIKPPAVEKPKKIFIPGVKISDFKKAYERKSSVDLSPVAVKKPVAIETDPEANKPVEPSDKEPSPEKLKKDSPEKVKKDSPEKEPSPEKVKVEDVASPVAAQPKSDADSAVNEEAIQKKKTAIEIIGNAIAKPPKPLLEKLKTRSPAVPAVPTSPTGKKFVKIQVGPNDVRNAVLQVSTPEQVKNFNFNENNGQNSQDVEERPTDKKATSKVEITLKSSTLPRRKTSKAEIQLGAPKGAIEYRTEVAHMVGAAPPPKLRNQRSEVAFPVAAAAPLANRSMSVEPESGIKDKPRERIIPIQFERDPEARPPISRPSVTSPPPTSRPPAGPLQQQRSTQSQRSNSLSRQSTLDSDTESSEPIKKSPREFIIPIAVEGGGYITPRAGSLEPGPENKPERAHKSQHRFNKPMRMGSLRSESGASDDEGFNSLSSPFSSLNRHRDGEALEDQLGAHMHRLRSSRPCRTPVERADSLSSGEEDDDDNFELLTAESLFSTLLSRVRNLTQRLNVDDGSRPAFPGGRFMNHNFPSHSAFFNSPMEPHSRRVSESTSAPGWRRSANRDGSDSEAANSGANPAPSKARHDLDDTASETSNTTSYYTPSLARRMQEARHDQYPPPLPSSRPISRTTSLSRGGIHNQSENNGDSRRSSFLESKDQFGSSDSLNYSGLRDYSRERSVKEQEKYHAPTRRTIGMLNDGNSSLPRRHQYRSSMSDTLDYARNQETLPPLPSLFGRSVQRSSSYLRQRAIDIANIYGAPLPYQEPTRLERGEADQERGRRSGTIQPVSRFRAGSLNRETGDRETVSQAIIRRQKSFDRLEQNDDSKKSKLRRPMSLDLRSTPDRSVLGKFLRDEDGRLVESEDGGLLRVGDQNPSSPVKSPVRKVSRFLRPDFYDTAREDSVFAKEKEEAAKEGGAGAKSKKENIASFLELNYADLERNIAKDLLAISENAIKQKTVTEVTERGSENCVAKDFVQENISTGVVMSDDVNKQILNNIATDQKLLIQPAVIKVEIVADQLNTIKSKSKVKVKQIALKDETATDRQDVDTTSKMKIKKKVKKVDEADGKDAKTKKTLVKTESASTISTSNKNKFLRSLDKTIDKFKSSEAEPKETKSRIMNVIRSLRESSLTPQGSDDVSTVSNLIKRAVSVDDCSTQSNADKSTNKIKKVIKSLKELTSNPKTNLDTESNLIKRATSVDDLSNPSQTKSNQVNSVLGMFRKMEEPKAEKKLSLLSRFRRTQSVYAGSSSDSVLMQSDKKMKRISLGPDSLTTSEEPKASKLPSKKLERPRSENLELDQNVSCSIKVQTPKKETLKLDAAKNGPMTDDVSITETVKVIKVVEREAIPTSSETVPPKITNGNSSRMDKYKDAQSTLYPGFARTERVKHYDPLSSSSVLSEDESESFDSCSIGSDSRTTSPLPPYHTRGMGATSADGGIAESIEDRIRRKSFYSRFNDAKKKPAPVRKTSVTGIPTLRESATPRKSSSFVNYTNTTGKQQ